MKDFMISNGIPAPMQTSSSILTVSALNQTVSRMLERNFPLLWVAGEISNFTRAASGHWYFTLKDASAQVRAVMFRGRSQYASFTPREGDKVEVRALVTLYAPRGDYQLNVEAIRQAGVGNLYEAFLRLKERLTAEGLFDAERKRSIPVFAKTIGIVTSPQAAALRDILITLQRRAPHVQIILYPTPVQGEGAAQKIAQAITSASLRKECDVLLICRGGGSIEDLWSFNDEVVARAIVASSMPVISGVGHETDFTIADFAADLRAPTPTAAAEMATTSRLDWISTLELLTTDLSRAFKRQLSDTAQTLDWLTHRLISPAAYIERERLKLRVLQNNLKHGLQKPLSDAKFSLKDLRTRLRAQLPSTEQYRKHLTQIIHRMAYQSSQQTEQRRQALATLNAQLELLNPQRTLERGYAIITDAKGHIIRTPAEIFPQQKITLQLAAGAAQIGVASVQETL